MLKHKTVLITGSTRGIGREIALRCAKEGANVVITGKTTEPHPKLPGTIHTTAEEVEKIGGQAIALELDVRDEVKIQQVVDAAAAHFGGIDILVNNASAIFLADTTNTSMKRYDLMMGVNVRATYACSQACIPYLEKGSNPHILNLSPPLNLDPKWFAPHLAYTMSKYGMSLCTLGLAEELKSKGIAVNSLWPKTTIATAAIKHNFPPNIYQASRTPAIVADAAYYVLTKKANTCTGQFLIDEDVLKEAGETQFDQYANQPGTPLFPDIFL
ncbi:MAG: short chain dehydrogenase [Legionellaceae bacterium]|nr:short chain dehydrogenase [Legionellaceae bacterium]